jgi:Lrp/AsnC family leucine-responsive transcriptional regulator
MQDSLDSFDRAILREVQCDARKPHRLIADAVGLSAPAVQRRIRRMEADGVIQANVALVDPARVGRAITLIVEVEIANERVDALAAMKRAFADDPEVQQCYYVTGQTDFVLIVTVATMADYEALTKRLFFANDNVKRFCTFVAMDRVKVGLALPVD